jgi:NADP-dependent 3-hydroxy acid dehydrogenase YdfG
VLNSDGEARSDRRRAPALYRCIRLISKAGWTWTRLLPGPSLCALADSPALQSQTECQAAKGYAIAVCSRSTEKLSPLVKDLQTSANVQAQAFEMDVASPDSIARAFKAIQSAAAGFGMKPVLEVSPTDIAASLAVGGTGSLVFIQEAANIMLQQKDEPGGAILLTGSTASLKGGAKFASFACATPSTRSALILRA